jgi:hypothetical protein
MIRLKNAMTAHPARLARAAVLLACLCPVGLVHAQASYTYSANGAEVTDAKTGLTWRRCSEGQSWSGSTCVGSADTFTHEQALAHAKTQSGWRLPNVKELSSLVDSSRVNPAIDITAFPATPSAWYWSSSPYAGWAGVAGGVGFGGGQVGFNWRDYLNHVRLVR